MQYDVGLYIFLPLKVNDLPSLGVARLDAFLLRPRQDGAAFLDELRSPLRGKSDRPLDRTFTARKLATPNSLLEHRAYPNLRANKDTAVPA